MNVGVPAADERRIKVPAQDLPLFGGVQLAADITLRSVSDLQWRTPSPCSKSGRRNVGGRQARQETDGQMVHIRSSVQLPEKALTKASEKNHNGKKPTASCWRAPDMGRLIDKNHSHTCPTNEMCPTIVATKL